MAVITSDILITGKRRDEVLEWLQDMSNHQAILQGAFDGVKANGDGSYELLLKVSPKPRTIGYRFVEVDTKHEGRRVVIETSGKRTKGTVSYSLKTMRPSTNTLVTAHMDYQPGNLIGAIVDSAGLREGLQKAFTKVLENLQREL